MLNLCSMYTLSQSLIFDMNSVLGHSDKKMLIFNIKVKGTLVLLCVWGVCEGVGVCE